MAEAERDKTLLATVVDDLRDALDREVRKNIRLEMEIKRRSLEADELRAKLDKSSKELKEATPYITLFNELNSKYDQLETEDTNLKEINMKLTEELVTEKNSIRPYQKTLENQILLRMKTENKLQSLKENLKFKEVILKQQLNETKNIHITELTNEIKCQLTKEYEKKFIYEVENLKNQAKIDIEQYKQSINNEFTCKIKNLENILQGAQNVLEISHNINGYIIESTSHKNYLLDTNIEIGRKVIDLEQLTKTQEENMSQKMQQPQCIMDTKIDLDTELRTYRNLLEGEEKRLGIIPNTLVADSIGKKRKLIQQNETAHEFSNATVDIEINKRHSDGQCVKLCNKRPKVGPQTRDKICKIM